MTNYQEIKEIIIAVCKDELVTRFAKVKSNRKADGSMVTAADLAVQVRVKKYLDEYYPATVFLGEEMTAKEQGDILASGRPTWCLDPLDGTSNFVAGVPYFSLSLALIEQQQVTFGMVYDPIRDELFSATKEQGASLNGHPLVVPDMDITLDQTLALIDFKRLGADLASRLVTERPYASQRSFGSVALDWCWLAAGRCHIYLHAKQNIWDYAAGNFIFETAGGYSATLDGEPVYSNELQPRSAIASPAKALFKDWCDYLSVPLA